MQNLKSYHKMSIGALAVHRKVEAFNSGSRFTDLAEDELRESQMLSSSEEVDESFNDPPGENCRYYTDDSQEEDFVLPPPKDDPLLKVNILARAVVGLPKFTRYHTYRQYLNIADNRRRPNIARGNDKFKFIVYPVRKSVSWALSFQRVRDQAYSILDGVRRYPQSKTALSFKVMRFLIYHFDERNGYLKGPTLLRASLSNLGGPTFRFLRTPFKRDTEAL